MLFCSIFAIEPDSFNSCSRYKCPNKVKKSKYVHVGSVQTKNKENGASLTVQINPTKYLVGEAGASSNKILKKRFCFYTRKLGYLNRCPKVFEMLFIAYLILKLKTG